MNSQTNERMNQHKKWATLDRLMVKKNNYIKDDNATAMLAVTAFILNGCSGATRGTGTFNGSARSGNETVEMGGVFPWDILSNQYGKQKRKE